MKLIVVFLALLFLFSCSSSAKTEKKESSLNNKVEKKVDLKKEAEKLGDTDKKVKKTEPDWVKKMGEIVIRKEGDKTYIYLAGVSDFLGDNDMTINEADVNSRVSFSKLLNETIDILIKKDLIKIESKTNSKVTSGKIVDKYIGAMKGYALVKYKIDDELLKANNINLTVEEFLKYVPKKIEVNNGMF